jgi:hypothetical protein
MQNKWQNESKIELTLATDISEYIDWLFANREIAFEQKTNYYPTHDIFCLNSAFFLNK